MIDDGQAPARRRGVRRRRVLVIVGSLAALLLIIHRPILQGLVRRIAIHYALKANLKAEFRVEGSVFSSLTLRNVHVIAIGPSGVESVDADVVRADYSLLSLLLHGSSELLRTVDVRGARVVLDPTKEPPPVPKPHRKQEITGAFPQRIYLDGVDLIVRNRPRDFELRNLHADFNPRRPGEFSAARVQLASGQAWSNLRSTTSYEHRDLFIRGLFFDDANKIDVLRVNASQIDRKRLALGLEATLGGGRAIGTVTLAQNGDTVNVTTNFNAEHIGLAPIAKFYGKTEEDLSGDVERVAINLTGVLSAPNTWNGDVVATVNQFKQGKLFIDRVAFRSSTKDGHLVIAPAEIVQGESAFRITGTAELPANAVELWRTPARLELNGASIDLAKLTAMSSQPLTGTAQISGRIDVVDARLNATLLVSAPSVGFANGSAGQLVANVRATKPMPRADSNEPWFAGLESSADFDVLNVRVGQNVIDEVRGVAAAHNDVVGLSELTLRRGSNSISAHGDARLPRDLAQFARQPGSFAFNVDAAQLADFWIENAANKISGPLQVSGNITWDGENAEGFVNAFGQGLRVRDLSIPKLSAQATVHRSVVYLNDFTALLDHNDVAAATGVFDLHAPYAYRGRLNVDVADVRHLGSIIGDKPMAGALHLAWAGAGEAQHFQNNGDLQLTLTKGRYADVSALEANVQVHYTPDALDIPIIYVASDKMNFQAVANAKGDTFDVSKLQLNQGAAKFADGNASLPFVWKNIGTDAPVVPRDGKVSAYFQTQNLDLRKLFEDVGAKPVVTGSANVKLDAHGTLADLAARLEVQATDLRNEAAKQLEPAKFTMTAEAQGGRLTVNGKVEQAKIQPVAITAQLPLDAAKMLRDPRTIEHTPLEAKVVLPRSSMNWVRQFVPALQTIDGDVALDVNVRGTIAKPELSGAGDVSVNVARFQNPTLPTVSGLKTQLRFAGDTLTIERFGGDLAGGPFTIGGRVVFAKLTDPQLDVQLKATSVLLARNDTLTARADADVRIAGPLNSATVTGSVAMTNSQFLKNLDLIPIGLPGRPPPQPTDDRPDISFPNPPLRDWKFDVKITTKDPFRIRGNLASGGAISDLHLTGTGFHPGLEGMVRLENVEATLPFSRLDIDYGYMYFDPSDSFNPKLDLHGTSVIRDYTVHVYVYGTKIAPEAVFSSEPPLPQEEIISLLATGTTREELTGNNNVLAGRAASLLFQQLYRKVFKKGEGAQSTSVFDRLDFDVGATDPRTGQQTASARFKINNQFVLLGEVGVGGDFRGQVKYLLRFK